MTAASDDELTSDEHRALAQAMLDRHLSGESKSKLEIEYWQDPTSHGQAFSNYVRRWLAVETVKRSSQSDRIAKAEALLRVHGIAMDDDDDLAEQFRLVGKAREAVLAALRVYNDPTAGFRTETFSMLMVIGWNTLCQAILERDGVDYLSRDEHGNVEQINGRERVLDVGQIIGMALPGDDLAATRANIDFFVGLRNRIAHRYLPALDPLVVPEAQAMLLNFERVIVAEFGEAAQLGDRLAVPLQLSGFRNGAAMKSLKELEQRLPPDVLDYLTRHRQHQPDDVARSAEYSIRVFLVPVAANRVSQADAVVNFVPLKDATDDLIDTLIGMAVVPKQKLVTVGLGGYLRPSEVVEQVKALMPFPFTLNRHAKAWHHYKVRPDTGSTNPELTDDKYCVYDTLSRQYGYTPAWVTRLVTDLSDPVTYETVTGQSPSAMP